MAYAEKRGKGPRSWRVKYKIPGGEAGQSGFETKQAALEWGRDQEAKIRAGAGTDPGAGEITVSEWIDRWKAKGHAAVGQHGRHGALPILPAGGKAASRRENRSPQDGYRALPWQRRAACCRRVAGLLAAGQSRADAPRLAAHSLCLMTVSR
jgi:hypothetical protein